MKTCPQCGSDLWPVFQSPGSYLNADQFDAVRAGDWYCTVCPDPSTRTGFTYFWDRDLVVVVPGHNED